MLYFSQRLAQGILEEPFERQQYSRGATFAGAHWIRRYPGCQQCCELEELDPRALIPSQFYRAYKCRLQSFYSGLVQQIYTPIQRGFGVSDATALCEIYGQCSQHSTERIIPLQRIMDDRQSMAVRRSSPC
jgi:hypothetical protein